MPAGPGTGVIAGSAVRAVIQAVGIPNVLTKCLGSRNPHNMVKATFAALSLATSPRSVANRRGKKVADLMGPRKDGAAEPAPEAVANV